jgi:hypothetical protein
MELDSQALLGQQGPLSHFQLADEFQALIGYQVTSTVRNASNFTKEQEAAQTISQRLLCYADQLGVLEEPNVLVAICQGARCNM